MILFELKLKNCKNLSAYRASVFFLLKNLIKHVKFRRCVPIILQYTTNIMDKITQQRIDKLHPSVRDEVKQIIKECDKALTGRAKVRITQGLRSFEEQEKLYAIGRITSGKKVTNAKAGQSIHNYGLAVDICLMIDGKTASWDTAKDWDNDQVADWYECVKIFARHGWDWGGNWKTFKDLPHFEKKNIRTKKGMIKTAWRTLSRMPRDKQNYILF